MNYFFFGVYPYICLTMFTLGLVFRYMATPGEWNARSSNLFAKKSLMFGSYFFHYAIILVFFGHFFGLLTPESVMTGMGFDAKLHTEVASWAGMIMTPFVLAGLIILLFRRFCSPDVWASTVWMDIIVILLIIFQAVFGGWQDYFGNFDVFDTVAPWIRSVLTCQARPGLMADVPVYLKLHVIGGLTLIALVPFSRLVHFISLPVTWFIRPAISYRRRYENL